MYEKGEIVTVSRKYCGLTWPTLFTGALVILIIALGYLWVIATAVQNGD